MDNQSYSSTDAPAQTESIFTDVIDTAPYEKSMKNARIWIYSSTGLSHRSASPRSIPFLFA
jgi:hypothetical protein